MPRFPPRRLGRFTPRPALPLPVTAPQVPPPGSSHRPAQATALRVVIVNFCQWRNTARLVKQLARSRLIPQRQVEILVVDNHSPSHPVIRQLQGMAGVTLRRLGRNHGFARAVNHACEAAGCEWILLLNPDVTVSAGFLDAVVQSAEEILSQHPQAGVIGFGLQDADGTPQPSAGAFPTLWSTLGGLFRSRRHRKCLRLASPQTQQVDWVTGGCFLVRRDCFEQLGGFDERFFLYYEDVDFCRRASTRGWTVHYAPGVKATHHWPLHARSVPAPLRLLTRHALITYARSHWPRWQWRLLARLIHAEARVRALAARLRGDTHAARIYCQLRALIQDLHHRRWADVRRRIRFAADFLQPIAAEQDGKTE